MSQKQNLKNVKMNSDIEQANEFVSEQIEKMIEFFDGKSIYFIQTCLVGLHKNVSNLIGETNALYASKIKVLDLKSVSTEEN